MQDQKNQNLKSSKGNAQSNWSIDSGHASEMYIRNWGMKAAAAVYPERY